MITGLLRLLNSLFSFYGYLVIGALIMMPIAYVLAPVWHFVDSLPHAFVETIAMLIYIPMALIGVGIIVDFLRPEAADLSHSPTRPEPLRLQDHAPWLQTISISEDEDEAPALSPPRKSLPAPARD